MRKIIKHLSFYVLIAILLGIFLGVFYPQQAVLLEPLAKVFIQVIKLFTYPIIFLTVTLGIASMGDLKKVGRIGLVSLVYFEVVSTLSLALGVVVALWFQPGKIDKSNLQMQDPTKYTQSTNFDLWGIIANNTNLQILLLAIITGFVLNFLPKRENYIHQIGRGTHYVFLGLKWVMYLAPIGALGGMSYAIGKYGLATLLPLGKLMVTMYMTMALFVFVLLGLLLRYYKLSIFKLFFSRFVYFVIKVTIWHSLNF